MRIDDRLNSAAQAVDHQVGAIPMRPADEVSRRSHTQRTLMYAITGTIAFAVIAGSALLFTGGSGTTVPTAPAVTSPAPLLSTELEVSSLDWQEVESTVRYLDNAFGWDGTVYALSTVPGQAPGELPAERAVYSSTDGLTWDENQISGDLWISDVDSHGGTIYAIATAPGVAEPQQDLEVRISSTSDFGNSWRTIDLPVIEVPSPEFGSVSWFSAGTKIAAGPAGVVATAKGTFYMDFAPLIPEELVTAHHYAKPTDEGLEIHDQRVANEAETTCFEEWERSQDAVAAVEESGEAVPTTTVAPIECELETAGIVATYTWEELGYSQQPETSFSRMYVSEDGSSFDSVDSPIGVGDYLEELVATNSGFAAVAATRQNDQTTRTLWMSPDGHQWERASLPDGVPFIQGVGSFGDKLILVGRTDIDVFSLFSSGNGGRSWEEVALPQLTAVGEGYIGPFPIDIDISEHGIVLALISEPTEGEPAVTIAQAIMTDDLETWSEVPLASLGSREGYVNGIVNTENLVLLGMTYFDGPASHATLVGTKG